MTASLCGSRFGRGLVRPAGVRFDVEDDLARDLKSRLAVAMKDIAQAVGLLWDSPSVMARFEGMGTVSRDLALELGLVGPSARACGVEHDVRADFPLGHYCFSQVPVSTWDTGDVLARAYVRWLEIQRSADLVGTTLARLPAGHVRAELRPIGPRRIAVALVEGWRGAICHIATTGFDGRIDHYKIVDPSFHNWIGLAMALRNNPISEFPLCNKSFNLSYCGHDL
jgi:Ni,Fe-hydrogenase III large subunit